VLSTAQSAGVIPAPARQSLSLEAKAAVLPLVSIIIAGRNSSRWILETIRSAARQPDCELIVVDDSSEDGGKTLKLLKENQEQYGYSLLLCDVHGGVVNARNCGAAMARGKFFLFLDADDIMTAGYVDQHLKVMLENPGCPFVYGSAEAFGEGPSVGSHWMPMEYDDWDRWGYNTVNTSSLYARWAFEAAGGWKEVPTMWDFDLALRAARIGAVKPMVSKAKLMYRQHRGSWSHAVDLANGDQERGRYAEIIHRRNSRLSIATIYSGRLPKKHYVDWLDRLACSVLQANLPEKPVLLVASDPAANPPLNEVFQKYSNAFAAVRIERLPYGREPHANELERRDSVCRFLARANQFICDALRPVADAVWFVEDDVKVPVIACRELWDTLTSGLTCPAAVSGLYRNRHQPEWFVGGVVSEDLGGTKVIELKQVPTQRITTLGVAGCGCLMTWLDRPMIPKEWPSHAFGNVPAHDWAYCQEVNKRGGVILMNSLVQCQHVVDEHTFV
jgi:glycosyltransferase involved in cell wall biosynthesis